MVNNREEITYQEAPLPSRYDDCIYLQTGSTINLQKYRPKYVDRSRHAAH